VTEPLNELVEFLAHQSWRCQYRTRYGVCQCGLDDLTDRLGLPRVAVDDPESPEALARRAELAERGRLARLERGA
jgi:hypothetical protein